MKITKITKYKNDEEEEEEEEMRIPFAQCGDWHDGEPDPMFSFHFVALSLCWLRAFLRVIACVCVCVRGYVRVREWVSEWVKRYANIYISGRKVRRKKQFCVSGRVIWLLWILYFFFFWKKRREKNQFRNIWKISFAQSLSLCFVRILYSCQIYRI